MIRLDNITKYFEHKGVRKYIFEGASCQIPSDKNVVILGKDGSGKSVLTNMIAGVSFPDAGKISCDEKISWPVGYKSSITQTLTARENVEFVSMLMQIGRHHRKHVHEFIQDFAELGKAYDAPVKTYAKSMRSRLSFALCFAFEFNTYLLDDFSFMGDSVLAEKAWPFINEKRQKSRLIMVSKNLNFIREYCDSALVIQDNKLHFFENIDTAVEECKKMFKNLGDIMLEDADDFQDE